MNILMTDTKLVSLDLALNPLHAEPLVLAALARSQPDLGRIDLQGVRLLRHKAGRRALVAYEFHQHSPAQPYVILGKLRAKGVDYAAYRLQRELAAVGFREDAPDGIIVAPALGTIPELGMWLQQQVAGEVVLQALIGPAGVQLGARIADAAHKLHQAGLVPRRSHSMVDELIILAQRLVLLAQKEPKLAARLGCVLAACRRQGMAAPVTAFCGIHRDFYFDQLLIDQQRLYLIDLDLYSLGDPALDIGNFIAHLTEYALRSYGNPLALAAQEQAMFERFLELNTNAAPETIHVYTTLSLARHIAISTQFPDRRHITAALLELCEQRLCLGGGGVPGWRDARLLG